MSCLKKYSILILICCFYALNLNAAIRNRDYTSELLEIPIAGYNKSLTEYAEFSAATKTNTARFLRAISSLPEGIEQLVRACQRHDETFITVYFDNQNNMAHHVNYQYSDINGQLATYISENLKLILNFLRKNYNGLYTAADKYNYVDSSKYSYVFILLDFKFAFSKFDKQEIIKSISDYCDKYENLFVWTAIHQIYNYKFKKIDKSLEIEFKESCAPLGTQAINQSRIFNVITDIFGEDSWKNKKWSRLFLIVNVHNRKLESYYIESCPSDSSLTTFLHDNLWLILSKLMTDYKYLYLFKLNKPNEIRDFRNHFGYNVILIDIPLIPEYEYIDNKGSIIRVDNSGEKPEDVIGNVMLGAFGEGQCIIE